MKRNVNVISKTSLQWVWAISMRSTSTAIEEIIEYRINLRYRKNHWLTTCDIAKSVKYFEWTSDAYFRHGRRYAKTARSWVLWNLASDLDKTDWWWFFHADLSKNYKAILLCFLNISNSNLKSKLTKVVAETRY